MPHECTNCGHAFPDGSKEMLSGCPDCGGNKFQFLPASAVEDDSSTGTGTSSVEEPTVTTGAPTVDESESQDSPADLGLEPEGESLDRGDATDDSFDFGEDATVERASDTGATDEQEDRAQASARSEVVSEDELPPSDEPVAVSDTAGSSRDERDAATDDERPDLSELREELNDQFESIKILRPGEYELNLMELYDREERIVALEEDGRYVIDVPSSWREDEE